VTGFQTCALPISLLLNGSVLLFVCVTNVLGPNAKCKCNVHCYCIYRSIWLHVARSAAVTISQYLDVAQQGQSGKDWHVSVKKYCRRGKNVSILLKRCYCKVQNSDILVCEIFIVHYIVYHCVDNVWCICPLMIVICWQFNHVTP